MSFQKILIPTDGSDNTKCAVMKGVELAKVTGGCVTALFVKDKHHTDELAKTAMAYVARKCAEAGITVREKIVSGKPAAAIVHETSKYDVVIMGTVGRTGISKALVGSVAEAVTKESACPVIVVKTQEAGSR